MDKQELIINDIINARVFSKETFDEILLRSNDFYKWFSNDEESIIVIIPESNGYEIEESDSDSLVINCDDCDEQFIEFTKNYIVVYQDNFNETEIIMNSGANFDDTKWKYIDSNEGYYIWYKRINDTYVWIID